MLDSSIMKNSLRFVFVPAAVLLAIAGTTLAAESGYVDFGTMIGSEKGQYVDVTLGKGVLKLASLVAKCKNAEAAQLISGLSRIRVNVVGLDEKNRAQATERVGVIRQELTRDGWEQIVAVRGKR